MNSITYLSEYFLNRITIYRLMVLGLWIIAGIAFVECFLGWIPYTPIDLILSLFLLIFTTRVTNALCQLFVRATPTPETTSIIALLLFFILTPLQSANDALFFIAAAALAVLSTYVLTLRGRAIFNPAAFGILLLSIAGSSLLSWWVATPVLLPFVLVLGFLVVQKTRQAETFWIFAFVALGVSLLLGAIDGKGTSPLAIASGLLTVSPLIFFGTLMLTDPQTTPVSKKHRRVYAFISGLFFPLTFSFALPFASGLSIMGSPELGLIIANIYSIFSDTRRKVSLAFHSTTKLSRNIYEFAFVSNSPLPFVPGQHIEVTSLHKRADNRGVRRYFSLSSAPSDSFVRFTTRMPVESSSFKDTLLTLKKEQQLSAVGPLGEFVLPKDPNLKLLMLAGNIGIAPFMSMFRELAARRERRDIVLVYNVDTPLDFAYQNEIDSFKDSIGLRTIYLPIDFNELSDWEGPSGFITPAFIEKEVHGYKKRRWYIAGPNAFVDQQLEAARTLGIPRFSIKKESFPGF